MGETQSTAVEPTNNNSSSFTDFLILLVNMDNAPNINLPFRLPILIFDEWLGYQLATKKRRDFLVQGRDNQNDLYLYYQVPYQKHFKPCSVRFDVSSRDQGWTNNSNLAGTRTSSYSWGEASLSNHPDHRFRVYTNKVKGDQWEHHIADFPLDSELVQTLLDCYQTPEEPPSIQLWIRSAYPGWRNRVRMAETTVHWKLEPRGEWISYVCSLSERHLSQTVVRKEPDFADVLILLVNVDNSSLPIPFEVFAHILSFLDLFPTTNRTREELLIGHDNQNDLYLSFQIVPMRCFTPCRITYEVESKDQGWSAHLEDVGTRHNSWTWGDAALSSDPSERFGFYTNLHAGDDWEVQRKVFPLDSRFVQRLLEQGRAGGWSALEMWVMSAFPGWRNEVRAGSISVAWRLGGDWARYVRHLSETHLSRKAIVNNTNKG